MESPWLFDFQDRLSTSDSFNANVNAGISQICKKVSADFHASLYSFRHSWATIAQNGCGASLGDIDFALNHSTYKMARVYTKIDYSPAWELNEKVIDYNSSVMRISTIMKILANHLRGCRSTILSAERHYVYL